MHVGMLFQIVGAIGNLSSDIETILVGELALIVLDGRPRASKEILQISLLHQFEHEILRLLIGVKADAEKLDNVLMLKLMHDDCFFEKVDALRRSG